MHPKQFIRISFFFLVATTQLTFRGFTQSSFEQVVDDIVRTAQLYGKGDTMRSLCVRPNDPWTSNDTLLNNKVQSKCGIRRLVNAVPGFTLMPVVLQQQYNTHHAYGWNDGSMIPAKGYQTQLSFGASYKKGLFSFQLRPEFVYAYNPYFSTFPSKQIDNIWYAYREVITNVIDAPERFGYKRYLKFFPGQSHLQFNYKKVSLGVSTESLWWGPGIRNSLLMSNNAPGFPHLSFHSSKPVTSPIGSFEWQLIGGLLKSSNILPDDTSRRLNGLLMYRPKSFEDRYINGLVMTWQPKWTQGLFLGVSRVFYQHRSELKPTLDSYLPVIGKFFKKNLPTEDALKRDQLASFFFRLILPKEKAEVYGEFGRNDHSYNLTDFLLQPEHSRAYIIGLSKVFEGRKKALQVYGEMTTLQMPSTMLIRAEESWYVHYQVREGYTNRGQVIGAGIGPGGSSQIIGLKWLSGFNRTGLSFERVVHNNDFYFVAFGPLSWKHNWVDLAFSGSKSWRTKNLIYDARLTWVHSLNYQWYYPTANNINARLGICYLFL